MRVRVRLLLLLLLALGCGGAGRRLAVSRCVCTRSRRTIGPDKQRDHGLPKVSPPTDSNGRMGNTTHTASHCSHHANAAPAACFPLPSPSFGCPCCPACPLLLLLPAFVFLVLGSPLRDLWETESEFDRPASRPSSDCAADWLTPSSHLHSHTQQQQQQTKLTPTAATTPTAPPPTARPTHSQQQPPPSPSLPLRR